MKSNSYTGDLLPPASESVPSLYVCVHYCSNLKYKLFNVGTGNLYMCSSIMAKGVSGKQTVYGSSMVGFVIHGFSYILNLYITNPTILLMAGCWKCMNATAFSILQKYYI